MARPESGILPTERCEFCHATRYSGLSDAKHLIDWAQWTGEDFFTVWPLPNLVLITEKVAELLLKLRVKSFTLRGFEDIDPVIWTTGISPGRLSNHFPTDFASKYGTPVGLAAIAIRERFQNDRVNYGEHRRARASAPGRHC